MQRGKGLPEQQNVAPVESLVDRVGDIVAADGIIRLELCAVLADIMATDIDTSVYYNPSK